MVDLYTRRNVTGRDNAVTVKGLLYGIAAIQGLPSHEQEFSDMCDMCEVLRAVWDPEEDFLTVWSIERRFGRELELWPNNEAMTPKAVEDRKALRSSVAEYQALVRERQARRAAQQLNSEPMVPRIS